MNKTGMQPMAHKNTHLICCALQVDEQGHCLASGHLIDGCLIVWTAHIESVILAQIIRTILKNMKAKTISIY